MRRTRYAQMLPQSHVKLRPHTGDELQFWQPSIRPASHHCLRESTPDTAQLALGDFDVVETVRTYAPRVQYIHFKDLGLDRRFTELGQGTIDFAATWEALGAESYEGWLVVDLDYTDLTADESCRVNKGYLNDTLGIKGLADGR